MALLVRLIFVLSAFFLSSYSPLDFLSLRILRFVLAACLHPLLAISHSSSLLHTLSTPTRSWCFRHLSDFVTKATGYSHVDRLGSRPAALLRPERIQKTVCEGLDMFGASSLSRTFLLPQSSRTQWARGADAWSLRTVRTGMLPEAYSYRDLFNKMRLIPSVFPPVLPPLHSLPLTPFVSLLRPVSALRPVLTLTPSTPTLHHITSHLHLSIIVHTPFEFFSSKSAVSLPSYVAAHADEVRYLLPGVGNCRREDAPS